MGLHFGALFGICFASAGAMILRGWSYRTANWVLIIGLTLTLCTTWMVRRSIITEGELRFTSDIYEIEGRLKTRLEHYENALIQTRALFLAQPKITREQFSKFVQGVYLGERYPGMIGLGYAERVQAEDLPEHERKTQRSGYPNYRVWPKDPPREEYFPIAFLEPLDERNQRALGFDMHSEETRRKAMDQAAAENRATASDPVVLVQESPDDPKAGFLIYLPIKPGDELLGFVYAPFRVGDLFEGIFGDLSSEEERLDFEVFAGKEVSPRSLLFDFDGRFRADAEMDEGPFKARRQIEFAGNAWTVIYSAGSSFEPLFSRAAPVAVFLVGTLMTLLLVSTVKNAQRHTLWQRERLEQEGRLTRDLKAALRARDEFLSVASHELKTPLTSLKLQAQLTKRHPDKIGKLIELTDRQTDRLSLLVDDMLDIARIQTGKLSIRRERFDLCSLVSEVADRMDPQMEQSGTQIRVRVCDNAEGNWDRFRIEQVITNLFTNAARYGQGKPVEVRIAESKDYVELSVKDQGKGIAKEDQERIFNRFERVGSSTNAGGLGLGLYITRQIVEMHGGTIRVESEVGKGALFVVRLPRSVPGELSVPSAS